jgi:glutamine amidotransferase
MGNNSEEGKLSGLGLIDMNVIKFDSSKLSASLKIPNMGWNEIHVKKDHSILRDMYHNPRFYFVHSYHFALEKDIDILSTSTYGYEFASSFQNNNISGVQFHPEKSHKYGMQLLMKFADL